MSWEFLTQYGCLGDVPTTIASPCQRDCVAAAACDGQVQTMGQCAGSAKLGTMSTTQKRIQRATVKDTALLRVCLCPEVLCTGLRLATFSGQRGSLIQS